MAVPLRSRTTVLLLMAMLLLALALLVWWFASSPPGPPADHADGRPDAPLPVAGGGRQAPAIAPTVALLASSRADHGPALPDGITRADLPWGVARSPWAPVDQLAERFARHHQAALAGDAASMVELASVVDACGQLQDLGLAQNTDPLVALATRQAEAMAAVVQHGLPMDREAVQLQHHLEQAQVAALWPDCREVLAAVPPGLDDGPAVWAESLRATAAEAGNPLALARQALNRGLGSREPASATAVRVQGLAEGGGWQGYQAAADFLGQVPMLQPPGAAGQVAADLAVPLYGFLHAACSLQQGCDPGGLELGLGREHQPWQVAEMVAFSSAVRAGTVPPALGAGDQPPWQDLAAPQPADDGADQDPGD